MENKELYVQREDFKYNGKTYKEYFIKGTVRGREVKIAIAPPDKETDKGGYAVLDLVFGEADKAEFVVEPFEIKDDKTHRTISGNRYLARTTDETGEVYECPVKPSRKSDRTLLQMLLR